jgi:hypothetical protein
VLRITARDLLTGDQIRVTEPSTLAILLVGLIALVGCAPTRSRPRAGASAPD